MSVIEMEVVRGSRGGGRYLPRYIYVRNREGGGGGGGGGFLGGWTLRNLSVNVR